MEAGRLQNPLGKSPGSTSGESSARLDLKIENIFLPTHTLLGIIVAILAAACKEISAVDIGFHPFQ